MNWRGLEQFVLWDFLLAAVPILLVWAAFGAAKKIGFFEATLFSQVLADAELFPWSIPFLAIAIRRVALSGTFMDWLLWVGILFLIITTAGHIAGVVVRYGVGPDDDRLPLIRGLIGGTSVFAAGAAIVVGALAVLFS